MKKIIGLNVFLAMFLTAKTQSAAENLIEGGKALIQLITTLRKEKGYHLQLTGKNTGFDSCAGKKLADLCFKNSSGKDLGVTLHLRTDTGYEPRPFSVKMLPGKQECLYELKSGIYKYRVETGTKEKILLSEGEFKLNPCDNLKKELKD